MVAQRHALLRLLLPAVTHARPVKRVAAEKEAAAAEESGAPCALPLLRGHESTLLALIADFAGVVWRGSEARALGAAARALGVAPVRAPAV